MKRTDFLKAAGRALRVLGPGCAALLLASCASFDGIGSSAGLRAPEDYAASATLPAQGGQWPEESWAGQAGGTALQALVDEALAGNPGLQGASARIAAAEALAQAARADAGLGSGARFDSTYQRYTENGIVPPPLAGSFRSDNQLLLNFSYDLDFWGRNAARLRAALSQEKMAQAEQHAARLALATGVARAWIQLGRQHAQLELIRQQLETRQKLLELARLRQRAGLDPENQGELERQQLAGLRTEQAQWGEAAALTRNQLAALMGKGPDRGLSIAPPALPAQAALPLPNRLGLDLLGRRPDIVAARWQVQAMQGDIDAAKAQFYPNVNLAGFAGLSSLGLANLLQGGSAIAGIGPAIRVPLFENGGLRAQLKSRVAAYDAAVATYNQTLADALRDVADQVQALRAATAQNGHLQDAVDAARNSLRLARQRELAGTASHLPVLAAEAALLVQRRIALDAKARRADLEIGLIKALGGGFDAAAAGLEPTAVSLSPTAAARNLP